MKHKQGGSPYSMDANLLHISYEGRHLEDPNAEAEESMWRWSVSPEAAPDQAEYLELKTKHPFIIARGGQSDYKTVWVRVTDADGNEGWGEAAPTRFR